MIRTNPLTRTAIWLAALALVVIGVVAGAGAIVGALLIAVVAFDAGRHLAPVARGH